MSADHNPAPEPVEDKPELALNRGDSTVAAALNGFISGAASGLVGGSRIDIATAYFNVGGYMLVADSLDAARETRLLLGAEPEAAENRPRRLAADIVRDHAPDRLTQQEIDRAVDTLSAPYPERTVRTLRAATNASTNPSEQAELILGVIRDLGLEPYTPPEPLPEITHDDIHLVCWLALA